MINLPVRLRLIKTFFGTQAEAGCVIPLAIGIFVFQFDSMQSHELLREMFQKCSAKELAAELGLSLSMIYKWAEPDDGSGSGTANPLDRIEALLRCTNDRRLVQWICQRAGGFFILNPKMNKPHPAFLIPATNEIVQEFADLLAVVATAASDNQVNAKEAETIRERWEKLKSVAEEFVVCCEQGSFSTLRAKPGFSTPR
jgi:transcriptional regulator with XRE-family HTH domain